MTPLEAQEPQRSEKPPPLGGLVRAQKKERNNVSDQNDPNCFSPISCSNTMENNNKNNKFDMLQTTILNDCKIVPHRTASKDHRHPEYPINTENICLAEGLKLWHRPLRCAVHHRRPPVAQLHCGTVLCIIIVLRLGHHFDFLSSKVEVWS
ncbi:hypothetical protein J6590_039702 [Homalodisca vitripennis]|nr:hypothetical protein J6590_039702 [Homalodisca vitripennis]